MTASRRDGLAEPRRLVVNPDTCQGHGRCGSILPERIDLDDLGYAIVVGAAVESDADDIARITMAIDNCPERAISLLGKD